jgi:hypothetical protein
MGSISRKIVVRVGLGIKTRPIQKRTNVKRAWSRAQVVDAYIASMKP